MSQHEAPDPSPRLTHVGSATSTRRVRQASIGSAISIVALVGVVVAASSHAQPSPSSAPVGDAGGTLRPPQTTQAATAYQSLDPTEPSVGDTASIGATSSGSPGPVSTPWRTSAPSTCDPYKKPCDPTVLPQYNYVAVMFGSATQNPVAYGKVTVVGGGKTYTCSVRTMPRPGCYWDIPPGIQFVASIVAEPGSYCTRFVLTFEDYVGTINHFDCTSITFTTRTLMGQLYGEFTTVPPPPTDPPPPTEPPATPVPTPAPTPEITAETTAAPS